MSSIFYYNRLVFDPTIWDRSSAWLERLPVKEEVEGSSPFGPAHEFFFYKEFLYSCVA